MIRMTIAGEEVVCDKELTINEEMLSTSSTILNNCYPKSWEQDHDYISRFYYPKDYSQCLIYQDVPIIPQEYTQVDYIQSDGNQYINTNLIGDQNTKFEISLMPTILTNVRHILGSINSSSNAISFNISTSDSAISRWGNVSVTQSSGLIVNNNYIISVSQDGYYINNNLWWQPTQNDFTTTRSMYLFGTNGSASRFAGRMYYCKIWNSDDLVSDLIPCYRNSDGVVGMYDLITQTFFENQGTGVFTCGQEQIETEEKLIFAGMVKNTGNISLNPRYPKYCSLEILDFKDFLSTGEYLDFVISNKTITEAIQMVVNAVSQYGFVLGNVNILNPDEIIGAYSTQEKSAYDVLQYLADITGSRWITRMIDENTVAIDFYDPTLMPSGLTIDYTQQFWCKNGIIDLTFNYGTRDYRNKQVMLSDKVFAGTDYNETLLADGYNTSYLTTTDIGLLKQITVNGVSVTFATLEDKDLGIDAEFYYSPGDNTLTTDNSYTAGTQIVVTYTPLVKGREVIYNTDEVSRVNVNTGRKGVIARYEQRNDVLSSDELKLIGQTYLKYKGTAEITLKLESKKDIYNIGESVYFNAPIQDLQTEYMVKRKSIQIIATTGDIFYTYELTSSFNSETAINWFDNQRNKASGNIATGEYITRNYDIENSANIIWDNLTITQITPSADNILNAPLNAPFTK